MSISDKLLLAWVLGLVLYQLPVWGIVYQFVVEGRPGPYGSFIYTPAENARRRRITARLCLLTPLWPLVAAAFVLWILGLLCFRAIPAGARGLWHWAFPVPVVEQSDEERAAAAEVEQCLHKEPR